MAVNALAVLLFSEDLRGDPTTGLGLWLFLMLPPVAMVHLIDYRHSRAAALLSLVLVAGLAALLAAELRSVLAVATAAPVLLGRSTASALRSRPTHLAEVRDRR